MPKLLVIPSIDIKDRKTVRVVQGIPELGCPEYDNDPVEMALLWRTENAKCLHVVDFDHAHSGSNKNFDIIREMCESVIIPVELGGGIRTESDAEKAFDLGVYRIVIGTTAFENPEEFSKILNRWGPKKVSAAIDVKDGEVIIFSRSKKTGLSAVEFAGNLVGMGVERLIVTDVVTNGMMLGPNLKLSRDIAEETGNRVTLSGGIGGFQDLMKVENEASKLIDSVIIGRALYENKFPCQKIWRVAESGIF